MKFSFGFANYLLCCSPNVFFTVAGLKSSFSDADYVEAGAVVLPGEQIFQDADIITKIRPPNDSEVPKLAGKTLISMIQPSINGDLYKELTEQNTNIFALDCVPRMLSRGQAFDTLSSQANIAGYRVSQNTTVSLLFVFVHRPVGSAQ